MKGFPSLINVLLASSLVLTIGRGVTLPFITIYLTEHFHLLPKSVGVILGVSLTLGILASLYGGYLVDKFSKNRLILLSIVLFALSFFAIPWIPRPGGVIVVLAILHTCYSVLSITIKACFADWLPVEQRIKAFSINYTLVNVGWAIGSALGVLVAGLSPLLPFYLSGGLALATVAALSLRLRGREQRPAPTAAAPAALPNFRQTVTILRSDRRLIYFTLGSTLGAVVFGQFTGYLSQYLITVSSAEFAYKIIGLVMIVNAGIVIAPSILAQSRHAPGKHAALAGAGHAVFHRRAARFHDGRPGGLAVDGGDGGVYPRRNHRHSGGIHVHRLYRAAASERQLLWGTEPQRARRRHQPGSERYAAQLCRAAVDVRDVDRLRAA